MAKLADRVTVCGGPSIGAVPAQAVQIGTSCSAPDKSKLIWRYTGLLPRNWPYPSLPAPPPEPRHFGALDGLAEIYLIQDDLLGAAATYKRILEIIPTSKKSQDRLKLINELIV